MKNAVSFNEISSMKNIVKKYFPGDEKLYCLKENEIIWCGATHDIDIMYIFNNRTWLDIWDNFNIFEIDYIIGISFYSLTIPVEYYREINNTPKINHEENDNNVRFFLTGLLYMCTIVGINDKSTTSQASFSILDHLDPKETHGAYYGYIEPMKNFFPSLVEKYTSEQLFLLSILFMKLPKYTEVSEMGQKYWTWIYENTDDDIREKIMKQFEEASKS